MTSVVVAVLVCVDVGEVLVVTVVVAEVVAELEGVEDADVDAVDVGEVLVVTVDVAELVAVEEPDEVAELVAVLVGEVLVVTVLVALELCDVVTLELTDVVAVLVAVVVTVVSLHSVKAPLCTPFSALFSNVVIVAQSSPSRPVLSSLAAVHATVPAVNLCGYSIRSITSFICCVTASHASPFTSRRSTLFTSKQLRSAALTAPEEHTESSSPRSARCSSQFNADTYCVVSSALICEQPSLPCSVVVAVVVGVVVTVVLCVEVALLLAVVVAVVVTVDRVVAVLDAVVLAVVEAVLVSDEEAVLLIVEVAVLLAVV